jgi:hypothetical protein
LAARFLQKRIVAPNGAKKVEHARTMIPAISMDFQRERLLNIRFDGSFEQTRMLMQIDHITAIMGDTRTCGSLAPKLNFAGVNGVQQRECA